MGFQFGNVVVVDETHIGVIVKSWEDGTHEVYVRSRNCIETYQSWNIKHYVYSKELHESERKFYGV